MISRLATKLHLQSQSTVAPLHYEGRAPGAHPLIGRLWEQTEENCETHGMARPALSFFESHNPSFGGCVCSAGALYWGK